MITLYNHQENLLALNPKRYLLAWGTGTGKTHMCLQLAQLNLSGEEKVLIIVPKALKQNWIDTITKYYPKLFYNIYSKEEFKKYVKTIVRHKAVIVDEAHYFSGYTSQMSKALYWYVNYHKIEYIWMATATPYLSTPMNLYTLARILGHAWHYPTFQAKFFYKIRMGSRMVPKIKDNIEKDLRLCVESIGGTVALEDCIDVPEQTFETIYVDRTKEQSTAITRTNDQEFIVRFTKIHQIENGTLKSDGYTPTVHFPNYKLDILNDLILTNKKIAIFVRYTAQIEYYKEQFKSHNRPIFVIDGGVKDRHAVVQKVESTEECIVLIQAQCSEGYELPSVPVCVFASMSFSLKDYIQSLGRFLRINKAKKNHYIHLVTRGHVDEAVYDCIKRKESFSLAIYNEETASVV